VSSRALAASGGPLRFGEICETRSVNSRARQQEMVLFLHNDFE
jgi:hypothetical protein